MKNILIKLKRNWFYFKGYKILFIINFILKFVGMAVGLINPLIYSRVVTSLVEKNIDSLLFALVLIVSLKILSLILGQITSRLELFITKSVNYNVKQIFLEKLLLIPPYKLQNFNDGKLYNLLLSDSTTISTFVFSVVNSLLNVFSVIGIGLIIFLLSWPLAIIVLLTYPITYFVNSYFGKKVRKHATEMYKKTDGFISFYKNMITNLNELKTINSNAKIEKTFAQKTNSLKDEAIKNEKLILKNSLIGNVIDILNYVMIMGCGSFLVFGGRLILGDFIAFGNYSSSFSTSLSSIINLNAQLQPSLAVLDRIEEFENVFNDSSLEESQKTCPEDITGDIVFENVSLALNNKQIIKDVSFTIQPGKINGIMGKNGSGKTTLFNLLVSIYNLDSGFIRINDIDIKTIKYSFLQNKIVYIKQNPTLYHMTILENLLIFNEADEVPLDKIREACSCVDLLDDIEKMPLGFDTEINDKRKLSAGQTQKLQIARALLMDKQIFLMDEATVNLDYNSKQKLYEIIKKLSTYKTIVFITNSENEKNFCDDIFIVQNE